MNPRTPEDETTHLWSLASERISLGSAFVARRTSAPHLDLANFVYGVDVEGPRALDLMLAEVDDLGGVRRLRIESRTPSWVEAELALRGWDDERELGLVLPRSRALTSNAGPHQVRHVRVLDPDWIARSAMLRIDHLDEDARHGLRPRPEAHTQATIDHRRDLEEYATYFCSHDDDTVTGFVCAWKSPSGTGVVEDVFIHPDHRGRGLASALLDHAVRALRGSGAGEIAIAAEVGDVPGRIYARLGFVPVRVVRSYTSPTRPHSTGAE